MSASVIHIGGSGGKGDEGLQVEAMGSYRRGEETCGDLDILITRDPTTGKDYKGGLTCLQVMTLPVPILISAYRHLTRINHTAR